MATYENDYTKEEDETLWEIHEIRALLHKDNLGKSNHEINEEAYKILQEYKNK